MLFIEVPQEVDFFEVLAQIKTLRTYRCNISRNLYFLKR